MSDYYENIYREIKCLNDKSKGQSIRCERTESKQRRVRKLIKYELMALGSFKVARLFN